MQSNDSRGKKLAQALLGEPIDLSAFGDRIIKSFREIFACEQAFYYHFAMGSLKLTEGHLFGYPISPQQFIERSVQYKLPLSPAILAQHGSGVYFVGEIMQWHREEIAQWSENYRFVASAGSGWGLTCLFLDREVLSGVAGIARPMEAGDYQQADIETLQSIFPTLHQGFERACQKTRERLLGHGAAAVFESHPNPLYLFGDQHELLYANYAGRLLMQFEQPGSSELPMEQRSALVANLREILNGGEATHPSIVSVSRNNLHAWGPERRQCTLMVVNAKPGTDTVLSPRQQQILKAIVACGEVSQAAKTLGISPATLRTHLRNIYRRIGASGLDEAIALFYSGESKP